MSQHYELRLSSGRVLVIAIILVFTGPTLAQSPSEKDRSASVINAVIGKLQAKTTDSAQVDEARSLGFDLLRQARYEEAWKVINAALIIAPNDGGLLYGGALALFNQQRLSESEQLARAAVAVRLKAREGLAGQSNSDAADAMVLLGVILAVRGDTAAALELVSQAVTIAPANFDAQFALGRARYGAGNPAGAAEAFRAALSLRPNHEQAAFFLATALEGAVDYKGALAAFRQLLKTHPDSADGHLGLGVLLIKLGNANTQEGIDELNRAIALNRDLYEARITLGRTLTRVGRAAEAVEHLRHAALLAPNNPEPHFQLAIAYRRTGRVAEANHESEVVQKIHSGRRTGEVSHSATSGKRPN